LLTRSWFDKIISIVLSHQGQWWSVFTWKSSVLYDDVKGSLVRDNFEREQKVAADIHASRGIHS